MDNHTIKNVFKEYIHPLDTRVIKKMIDMEGLDKYVKKLDILAYIHLFIYAQLKKSENLAVISRSVSRIKTLQRLVGMDNIVKLHTIPAKIWHNILYIAIEN